MGIALMWWSPRSRRQLHRIARPHLNQTSPEDNDKVGIGDLLLDTWLLPERWFSASPMISNCRSTAEVWDLDDTHRRFFPP